MDYVTLHNKQARTDERSGETIKDMMTLTFVMPPEYQYKLFKVTKEYIARPDLISIDQYGSSDYADIICKLNGISNPYELNVDMYLIMPLSSQISYFSFNNDSIESQVERTETAPKAKKRNEKRKANEAIIGDKRFKIDKDRRIVIY